MTQKKRSRTDQASASSRPHRLPANTILLHPALSAPDTDAERLIDLLGNPACILDSDGALKHLNAA